MIQSGRAKRILLVLIAGRFLVTRDDVDYTGVDIVPELIESHRVTYKQFPWTFL